MTASDAPALAVLLSTYNGERFLAEQLNSLLGQSYDNFRIVVRDDGSSDDTPGILRHYAAQHSLRMHLLPSSDHPAGTVGKNLGASASFGCLLQYVLDNRQRLGLDRAYMLLCDQDDIWFPDKIERQLRQLLAVERKNGVSLPVLVHSDLRVVSGDRQLIAESLTRFQGLETERNRFCQLVISNLVTGCTALINESLARKALPVPDQAIMHDWWLALVAAAFGELVFMDKALVHYRQHDSNAIGAKQHPGPGRLHALRRLLSSLSASRHLMEVAQQAEVFLDRFGGELSAHDREGLQQACRMRNRIGILQRLAYRRARRF